MSRQISENDFESAERRELDRDDQAPVAGGGGGGGAGYHDQADRDHENDDDDGDDDDEDDYEDEPDFSDDPDFVDDVDDATLLGDILARRPKESDGVDSVVVVDGTPVVGPDRLEKLKKIVAKVFGQVRNKQTEN